MQESRLERMPFFENLTAKERDELEALLEPANFDAGEVIIKEGDPAEYLYVLTSGTVDVHKEVFSGRRQLLATLEAPTVVGEVGLLSEPRGTATVTAKDSVEAQRLSREAFLEKLGASSSMAYKLSYEIGRALAEKMAHTDESIAKIIARLEDTESDRDFNVFREKLTQEWSF